MMMTGGKKICKFSSYHLDFLLLLLFQRYIQMKDFGFRKSGQTIGHRCPFFSLLSLMMIMIDRILKTVNHSMIIYRDYNDG